MTDSGEQKTIRILLVDDHALIRRGMNGQFTLEPGFSVVGEAGNGLQAIELAAQVQPDVVLMDIDMPEMDGITATQQIKSDNCATRILALSAFDNDTQVMGMLGAGADGYCLKTIEWEQLVAVIQLILQGGAYLDPQIAILETIQAARPHLLLVAMGVPQQEIWIDQYASQLRGITCMGVGGLFDFVAQRVPRAPYSIRAFGMEWMWRLAMEPTRLWRRYIIGNLIFLGLVIANAITPNQDEQTT